MADGWRHVRLQPFVGQAHSNEYLSLWMVSKYCGCLVLCVMLCCTLQDEADSVSTDYVMLCSQCPQAIASAGLSHNVLFIV